MRRILAVMLVALVCSTAVAPACAQTSPGDDTTAKKDANRLENFVETYSGGLLILIMFVILVITLIIVVPQLLRAHLRKAEMTHLEHLKALENGKGLPLEDDRARVAGRTAMLVPMVVMIAAGTVTCFLIAYRAENLFTVTLAVWVVAGVVSLAAITGGVALIARLAQLHSGHEDDDESHPQALG